MNTNHSSAQFIRLRHALALLMIASFVAQAASIVTPAQARGSAASPPAVSPSGANSPTSEPLLVASPPSNPQSAIRNPQSAIRNPQSAIRNPQSAIPSLPPLPIFLRESPRAAPETMRLDQGVSPSISKSASITTTYYQSGVTFTYTVAFTIPAGTTITNAVLVDTLPDNNPGTEPDFRYVAGSSVGPTPGAGTPPIGTITPTIGPNNHPITWTLGTLANPGGTPYVYSFTYRVNLSGGDDRVEVGTNNAALSHEDGSVAASTDVTVARARLALAQSAASAIDSVAPIDLLRANDIVTFTLYATNTIDYSTAYDVVISDTLPDWMVFGGPVGSTPPPDAIAVTGGRQQMGWRYASLAPGASIAPLVFTATVTSTVAAGRDNPNDLRGEWRDLPEDPTFSNATNGLQLRSANVSVSKTEVDAFNPQGRIVVNEPITYTILVTIPAGTTVYSPAHVFDNSLVDGLNFGGEAAHSGYTAPGVVGPSGSNTMITWTLTSTLATSSDITLTFVFTAYSDGTLVGGPIAKGATLNNTANVRWNIGTGSGLNNPITPQSVAGVQFVRPDIQPNKDSTPSAVVSTGGEVVQYRITNLRNGSGTGDGTAADAFDVIFTDTLPAGFGFVEAVPPPMGVFTLGNTVVLTWGVAPSLPVGYYYNPPGITTTATTIYVTATAPITFSGATAYTNTAVIQYSDQPGDVIDEQTYLFTRTKTLGVNFFETKAVTPTGQVRIGDVLTYIITDSIPAGAMMYWPRHQDDLPNGVRFVSGTLALQGTTFVSSPIPITVPQGTQDRLLWWTETVSNAYGSAPLIVTATFQARVTGINVSGGAVFSSTGEFRGAPGFNNGSRIDWSTQDISTTLDASKNSVNNVGNNAVQPYLADSPFAKLFGGSTSGSTTIGAGDVVTYHLVITNTGQGRAYDVVISDTLPAGLEAVSYTASGRTFGGAVFTPTFSVAPAPAATGAIGWVVDSIEPGDGNTTAPSTIFTLTYSALAQNSVGAGAALPNQALLADYSSLPGDDPFERHYNFLLGATRAVTLNVPPAAITKTANLTGANWLDLITYTLAFPQPPVNASLYNVTVTDTLPTEITILGVQSNSGQTGFSGSLVTATATSLAPQSQMVITITGQIDLGASGTKVNTALLEWDDAASGGSRHTATSNAVSTTILLPELGIAKRAPAAAIPGRTFTYTIAYSNTGTSSAANVLITDNLPDETVFVTATVPGGVALVGQPDPLIWNAGSLAVGQGQTIVVTVSLPLATPLGAILTNTASITTTTPGDDPANNAITVTTLVAASQLSISKIASPDPAESGQPIAYTLTVTNTGNAATSGLIVTDALPLNTAFGSASAGSVQSSGRITWTLAPLAPGASTGVTFTAIVASPLITGTLITNADYGAVADNSINTATGSPVTVVAHSRPRLNISKSGPAVIGLGTNVMYSVLVTNSGTTDALGVTLTDNLPDALNFASFSASSAVTQTAGPDPLGFDLGPLPPGGSHTIWITTTAPLTLTTGTLLTNTASVATTTPGEDASDNTAQHVATVSGVMLDVRKTANASTVAPAGTIVYTIEYSNTGTAMATGVVVSDTYDPNVTFVSANPAPNIGNNVWNTPGTLNAGERRTIVVTVTVAPALPNGTPITNRAQVSAAGAASAQAIHVVNVTSAAVLTIDKTGHGATMPGYTVVYRLNYANIGNAPATNARVTETYPSGLTFVAASPAPSAGNNVWNLGTIVPPANGTIVVTLTVGVGVPFGTLLTNTVAFGSDEAGPVVDAFTTRVGPVYLPLVMKNYTARPNLVVQNIVVTPASPVATQSTLISVTIANTGPATAPAGFWIDLYVDPSGVPQPGQPWNETAPVGKAWVLRSPLLPGQSLTLDTAMLDDPNDPSAVYSNWPGWFATSGAHTLYAQVDSFGGANGLVVELSELDNLFGPLSVVVNAAGSIVAGENTPGVPPLDPRPTPNP
ncbi:MAG TPA: hypothetical protein VIK33_06720 [Anaerolineae bacterium]